MRSTKATIQDDSSTKLKLYKQRGRYKTNQQDTGHVVSATLLYAKKKNPLDLNTLWFQVPHQPHDMGRLPLLTTVWQDENTSTAGAGSSKLLLRILPESKASMSQPSGQWLTFQIHFIIKASSRFWMGCREAC